MTKRFLKTKSQKWEIAIRSLLISTILSLVFASVSFAAGGGRYSVDAWSFGLMADTQWTALDENYQVADPEGLNPETVSAALAGAIGEEFIDYGVKFVIQVGDLSDQSGDAAMYARAAAAQPLTDAGIGFFPLRGNHETYGKLYGHDSELDMNLPAFRDAFPQTQGTANTFGATNFSSPSDIMAGVDILDGLSYSFDYGNQKSSARFVIVDVEVTSYWEKPADPHPTYGQGYDYPAFMPTWVLYKYDQDILDGNNNVVVPANTWFRIDSSGNPSTSFHGWENYWPLDSNTVPQAPKMVSDDTEFWPGMQQDWISAQLDKATRGTDQAFVLSHRGLMGGNHVDGFFGSWPGSKQPTQNTFYQCLADNDVRYMLSGHDHLHNRAIVESPDGVNQVQQIIHMAASTKFYGPGGLNEFYGTKSRETQIAQDLYNVGYYIYTIDGPRVTVDYYADSTGNFQDAPNYPFGDDSIPERLYLPDLDFVKKESFGYSTNGEQFTIAQGESYTIVEDTFGRTRAEILSGTNNSTTKDETPVYIDDNDTPDDPSDDFEDPSKSAPRALTKVVNTGWVKNPHPLKLKSDILSLWGMGELGSEQTDTYVLSMNLNFRRISQIIDGRLGIATYVNGKWVNAVNENFGGRKRFVVGPYSENYGLGTYGVDPVTRTAWAVLNYNADFAVANGIEAVMRKTRTRSTRR